MKKCPYCAEEIQDEAIKCRYCGEFLDGARPPALPTLEPEGPKLPWYFRTTPIVLMILSIPPLALPMVWWHPKYKLGWKLALTVAIGLLTWATVVSLVGMMKALNEMEKILQG